MFKAKLIEDDYYYKLRYDQIWFMLLPVLPIVLILQFYFMPRMEAILIIGLYVVIVILMRKNQKQMSSLVDRRRIEIDETEIRIMVKKKNQLEVIHLDEIDQLRVIKEYCIPGDSIKEHGLGLDEQLEENFIILKQKGKDRRFDFEVDSHYMITQLNKVIESWKEHGYAVEVIDEV